MLCSCTAADGRLIVTGGADGYLRLWNGVGLMELEAPEGGVEASATPLAEVQMPHGYQPRAIAWHGSMWVVQCEAGRLVKVSNCNAGHCCHCSLFAIGGHAAVDQAG